MRTYWLVNSSVVYTTNGSKPTPDSKKITRNAAINIARRGRPVVPNDCTGVSGSHWSPDGSFKYRATGTMLNGKNKALVSHDGYIWEWKEGSNGSSI